MDNSKKKIASLEYEISQLKKKLEKSDKEKELLKEQNQILLDTSTKMALEINVLQKNYENFKDFMGTDSLLESSIVPGKSGVKKMEIDNFMLSLSKCLNFILKKDNNFNKENMNEIIQDLSVKIDILNDFSNQSSFTKKEIINSLEIFFNKKIYKNTKEDIKDILEINLLDKKKYIQVLLELFENEKEEIFEDNIVWKKIRKIQTLNYNQKILLTDTTNFYLKENYHYTKNLCMYLSNEDLGLNFRNELYEEIIFYGRKNQFSFLKHKLNLKNDDSITISKNIVNELKNLTRNEKDNIFKEFGKKDTNIKNRIRASILKDFIHPKNLNLEFDKDKGKFLLPSSNLTQERLEIKVLFDIRKTRILEDHSKKLIENLKKLKDKIIDNDFLMEQIKDKDKWELEFKDDFSFYEKRIAIAFNFFLMKYKLEQYEILEKIFFEKWYLEFIGTNLKSLNIDTEEIKNLFLSKINNKLKSYFLKYFKEEIEIPEKDQNLLNFLIDDSETNFNSSKIFKNLVWIKWNIKNEETALILKTKKVDEEKFDLILNSTFLYINKQTQTKSFCYDLKLHLKNLSEKQKKFLFIHLNYLEKNINSLEDIEDIFLYVKYIAYIPYNLRTLLFIITFHHSFIHVNHFPKNEKELLYFLENKIQDNSDLYFKEKMIKEYFIMSPLVKKMIFDCFILMTKKKNFTKKLKKMKMLGRDVYKFGSIIMHLLNVYFNTRQNTEFHIKKKAWSRKDFEIFLIRSLSMEIENWFIQDNIFSSYELLFLDFKSDFLNEFFNFYRLDYETDFFKLIFDSKTISYENKKTLYDLFNCLLPYKNDIIKKAKEGKNIFLRYLQKEFLPQLPYYTLDYYPKKLIKEKLKTFSDYEIEFTYNCLEDIIETKDYTKVFDLTLKKIDRFDLEEENKRSLIRYITLSFEQINFETFEKLKKKLGKKNDRKTQLNFIEIFLNQLIVSDWEDENEDLHNIRKELISLNYEERQILLDRFLDSNLIDVYKNDLLKKTEKKFDRSLKIFEKLSNSNKLKEVKKLLKSQIYQLHLSSLQKKSDEKFDINDYNNLEDYYQDVLEIILHALKDSNDFIDKEIIPLNKNFLELSLKEKIKVLFISKFLSSNEKFQSFHDIKTLVNMLFLKNIDVYSQIIYVLYNEIYENREEFLKKVRECDFEKNDQILYLIKNVEKILTEVQNKNVLDFNIYDKKFKKIRTFFFENNIIEKLRIKKINLSVFFKKCFEIIQKNYSENFEKSLKNYLENIFDKNIVEDLENFFEFCFRDEKNRQLIQLLNSFKKKSLFREEKLWIKLILKIFLNWENEILDGKLEKALYFDQFTKVLERMDKGDLERFYSLDLKFKKSEIFNVFKKNNDNLEEVCILTLFARHFYNNNNTPSKLIKKEILNIILNPSNLFFNNIYQKIYEKKNNIDYIEFSKFLETIPKNYFGFYQNYDFIFSQLKKYFKDCNEQHVILLLEFLFLPNFNLKSEMILNLKNNKVVFPLKRKYNNIKVGLYKKINDKPQKNDKKNIELVKESLSFKKIENNVKEFMTLNNNKEKEINILQSSFRNNFSESIGSDDSDESSEAETIESPELREIRKKLMKTLLERIYKKENLKTEAKILSKLNTTILAKEGVIRYARKYNKKIDFKRGQKSIEKIKKIKDDAENKLFENRLLYLKKGQNYVEKAKDNFDYLKDKLKSVKRLDKDFAEDIEYRLTKKEKKHNREVLEELQKNIFKFYSKINTKVLITKNFLKRDSSRFIQIENLEISLIVLENEVRKLLEDNKIMERDIKSVQKKFKNVKKIFYHINI